MPRSYCVAYGCVNSTVSKPELSFFKLPTDSERCSQWLHLINREDLMKKTPKNSTVCEEHFNVMDIRKGTRRKNLKINSLPSLRLPDLQKKDEQTQKFIVEISTQTKEHFHTVYDVPIEEYIIQTEYESDHDERSAPGEEESVEPKSRHSLIPVEWERGGGCDSADVLVETAKHQKIGGSSASAEDQLETLTDRLRNDNSIGNVSTATAKDMVELLQSLTQGDSFDVFGRYVASSLRSMPVRRAQDLQPRIVELLVRGASGGGGDGH